jgi:serine/threonine protein kinase
MGEVYRAHDSRLGRDVATKILPEHFVADPERVARFQREAQVLAALNLPGIQLRSGVYPTVSIVGRSERNPDIGECGGNPRWRADGKELFFIGPQRYLMAVDLKTVGDTLEAGPEKRLFQLPVGANGNYTLTADGQRFVFDVAPTVAESAAGAPLTTVFNWTAILNGDAAR